MQEKVKKKILFIDDEQDLTAIIKLNLEATGLFEVRTENSGSAALSAAISFGPDMVLLDIALGDMDGSDVARQLKGNEHTKHIPIVYVTALVNEDEEGALRDFLGGYPFVAKPVSMEKLIEIIEKNILKK